MNLYHMKALVKRMVFDNLTVHVQNVSNSIEREFRVLLTSPDGTKHVYSNTRLPEDALGWLSPDSELFATATKDFQTELWRRIT